MSGLNLLDRDIGTATINQCVGGAPPTFYVGSWASVVTPSE